MFFSFEIDDELSEIITRLWDMDDNKCEPYEHYKIDLQGKLLNFYVIPLDKGPQCFRLLLLKTKNEITFKFREFR